MGKKKEVAVLENMETETVAAETEQAISVVETVASMEIAVAEPVQELQNGKGKKAKKKKEKSGKKGVQPLVLTAFITSIIFLLFQGGLIAPLISIVLAIVGLIIAKKKGMGGIVLGIVAIVLSVLTILFSLGDILVDCVKGLYAIYMLMQGIVSLFVKYDGNIFVFLGRIIEVVNRIWLDIARYAKEYFNIDTLYYTLNGMNNEMGYYQGYVEFFGIRIETIGRTLSELAHKLYELSEKLGF